MAKPSTQQLLSAAFLLSMVVNPAAAQVGNDREEAMLEAHNVVRAENGGVPPLVWSAGLAEGAHQWATRLAGDPACVAKRSRTKHGENLYRCTGICKTTRKSLQEIVESWASESQWYDPDTRLCTAPPGQSCGHFTQIVWCGSRQVGCGWAECAAGLIAVCRYAPPGNWLGISPLACSANDSR